MIVVPRPTKGRFEARRVIVALPPTLAGRIFYRPGLPANRDGLTQRAFMAHDNQVPCRLSELRSGGRRACAARSISDETVVDVTHDNSPPSGHRGSWRGFSLAKHGRAWADQPEADIRRTVLAAFGKYSARRPPRRRSFYIANWPSEIWSRGCYSGIMPYRRVDGLSERIAHARGSHSLGWDRDKRPGWCQYMDGAVRSGERAAEEVLQKL